MLYRSLMARIAGGIAVGARFLLSGLFYSIVLDSDLNPPLYLSTELIEKNPFGWLRKEPKHARFLEDRNHHFERTHIDILYESVNL
jgi:hypothetical protein